MARFDIYQIERTEGYLLDIQADFLGHIDTRVVVPLLPSSIAATPLKTLNPIFRVGDDEVVMATQLLAAVPKSVLHKYAGSLSHQRDEIVRAVDFLMQGF